MVILLPEHRSAELRSAACTYPEVGATADGDLPFGYRRLSRSRAVRGRSFESAGDQLMTWQVQERAGLRVAASARRAATDEVVLLRLGRGPATVRIPCRVVYTVDETDRTGFAYGTLPGHPESGEELFLLERRGTGAPVLTITAFSRPATLLSRAGGPLARLVQTRMTERYLRALDQPS